jgi:hypothetical protein
LSQVAARTGAADRHPSSQRANIEVESFTFGLPIDAIAVVEQVAAHQIGQRDRLD